MTKVPSYSVRIILKIGWGRGMRGMLYHTGYRLIDKDDLLLLSTAVYISSHGDRIFIEIVSASVFIEREEYVCVCVYVHIFIHVHTGKNESRKRISMGYRGLLSFVCTPICVCVYACVCFRCNCSWNPYIAKILGLKGSKTLDKERCDTCIYVFLEKRGTENLFNRNVYIYTYSYRGEKIEKLTS